MKKTVLTIAILLGMTLCASAQGGGLFGYGSGSADYSFSNGRNGSGMIGLPSQHDGNGDVEAETPSGPLGSGALLLMGFGAAYALKKAKRK